MKFTTLTKHGVRRMAYVSDDQWSYPEPVVKEFIEVILKYIKRQNFNGSYGYLKKNILNYIKEKAGEKFNK